MISLPPPLILALDIKNQDWRNVPEVIQKAFEMINTNHVNLTSWIVKQQFTEKIKNQFKNIENNKLYMDQQFKKAELELLNIMKLVATEADKISGLIEAFKSTQQAQQKNFQIPEIEALEFTETNFFKQDLQLFNKFVPQDLKKSETQSIQQNNMKSIWRIVSLFSQCCKLQQGFTIAEKDITQIKQQYKATQGSFRDVNEHINSINNNIKQSLSFFGEELNSQQKSFGQIIDVQQNNIDKLLQLDIAGVKIQVDKTLKELAKQNFEQRFSNLEFNFLEHKQNAENYQKCYEIQFKNLSDEIHNNNYKQNLHNQNNNQNQRNNQFPIPQNNQIPIPVQIIDTGSQTAQLTAQMAQLEKLFSLLNTKVNTIQKDMNQRSNQLINNEEEEEEAEKKAPQESAETLSNLQDQINDLKNQIQQMQKIQDSIPEIQSNLFKIKLSENLIKYDESVKDIENFKNNQIEEIIEKSQGFQNIRQRCNQFELTLSDIMDQFEQQQKQQKQNSFDQIFDRKTTNYEENKETPQKSEKQQPIQNQINSQIKQNNQNKSLTKTNSIDKEHLNYFDQKYTDAKYTDAKYTDAKYTDMKYKCDEDIIDSIIEFKIPALQPYYKQSQNRKQYEQESQMISLPYKEYNSHNQTAYYPDTFVESQAVYPIPDKYLAKIKQSGNNNNLEEYLIRNNKKQKNMNQKSMDQQNKHLEPISSIHQLSTMQLNDQQDQIIQIQAEGIGYKQSQSLDKSSNAVANMQYRTKQNDLIKQHDLAKNKRYQKDIKNITEFTQNTYVKIKQ